MFTFNVYYKKKSTSEDWACRTVRHNKTMIHSLGPLNGEDQVIITVSIQRINCLRCVTLSVVADEGKATSCTSLPVGREVAALNRSKWSTELLHTMLSTGHIKSYTLKSSSRVFSGRLVTRIVAESSRAFIDSPLRSPVHMHQINSCH